ncbi:cytochrome P450 [Actinospica robiniae]|uniref:cytochrome P450 n=1 Tax=Actinospica robiniae TaxID=304901 RepID=UPI000405DB46|nr:cytochrome P450 [Actinospica robiniae]
MSARSLDRRVYLRSHPLLFGLISATRPLGAVWVGRTLLVHDAEVYREILTNVPLDREAEGTTGGAALQLGGGGVLFDQAGDEHREARRSLAADLGAEGVSRVRPIWQGVIERGLTQLPGPVDLVPLAKEIAGATACALTGCATEPLVLAEATVEAASNAAGEHLPRLWGHRRVALRALRAADALSALLPDPLDAMLAVAAVNTTLAALPRAAAWCARAELWDQISPELTSELLRVTAPTPILPRVAAAGATIRLGDRRFRIRAGDRLILVARHAAEAHRDTARNERTAAQAVFGAGPHACPGANLARAQLTDFLTALVPHRPEVRKAVAARGTALPGYAKLVMAGSRV